MGGGASASRRVDDYQVPQEFVRSIYGGKLSMPVAVLITRDDHIAVLDASHAVRLYDNTGKYRMSLKRRRGDRVKRVESQVAATPLSKSPDSSTPAATGTLGHRLHLLASKLPGDDIVGALAETPEGYLVVSDSTLHRVQVYNRETGKCLFMFGAMGVAHGVLDTPTGVAVAPNGDIFVSDTKNSRVQRFSSKGEYRQTIGLGVLKRPIGMVAGPKGIYVADMACNKIACFSFDGAPQSPPITTVPMFGVCGLGIGPSTKPGDDSFVFFAAGWGGTVVEVFTEDGELTNVIGQSTGDKDGQLIDAVDVSVSHDGDTVAVCDRVSGRVSIFVSGEGSWGESARTSSTPHPSPTHFNVGHTPSPSTPHEGASGTAASKSSTGLADTGSLSETKESRSGSRSTLFQQIDGDSSKMLVDTSQTATPTQLHVSTFRTPDSPTPTAHGARDPGGADSKRSDNSILYEASKLVNDDGHGGHDDDDDVAAQAERALNSTV